jgi:hypothetical protein
LVAVWVVVWDVALAEEAEWVVAEASVIAEEADFNY